MTEGIHFEELHLKNMPFFKDQSFRLDANPISIILGKNLDSSNNNPNAAGKSFFFSQLPEMLSSTPVIGTKRDVIRKGSRSFTVRKGSHTYQVVQSFSPKEKLQVIRDGADLEFRELSAARAYIKKLIPFSTEEIGSLLYLNSLIPHPLVRGDTSTRKKFFTEFFRLHTSSNIRKLIKKDLDELQVQEGVLKEVQAQLQELNEKKVQSVKELKKELVELQSQEEDLRKKSIRQYEVLSVVKSYESIKDKLSSLIDIGITDLESLSSLEKDLKKKLRSTRDDLADWDRYEDYKKTHSDFLKRSRVLKEKLQGVDSPGKLKQLRVDLKTKRTSIQEKVSKAEVDVEIATKHFRKSKSRLEELDENLSKEFTGKCPTCGADYEDVHELAARKAWKKERRELSRSIPSYRDEKKSAISRLDSLRAKATHIDDSLSTVSEQLDLWGELSAMSDLKEIPQPSISKRKLEKKEKKLKAKLDALSSAPYTLEVKSSWDSLSKSDRKLASEAYYADALIDVSSKINSIKVELEEAQDIRKRLSSLQNRVSYLTERLAEKPILELLLEATSKKNGYESIMIRTLCSRLEQLVNKYARFILPETFKFTFDLQTQFDILAHRSYGKKTIVSDVRKLSGSESLLFVLILLVSLMSFTPKKNRPSVLIMDEPHANMGAEMIESFVKFLPVLNSVIPHIIIITPKPHQDYGPGAKFYTVVKKNGKSKIVEGKV